MEKKRNLLAILALSSALVLAACGTDGATEELDANDDNKAEAKVGDEATEATAASSDGEDAEAEETAASEEEQAKEDDIWTYYEDATWSDDFEGLKSEIQKVVVTEKAPTVDDESAEESAVGVKFRMENTTDGKFTTYPDQAVLVTSTGEQIDMPDMFISDNLGGEIDKGVIKEGNIIWYLERGQAEQIEWIKMTWDVMPGDEMSMDFEKQKTYEVELQLK